MKTALRRLGRILLIALVALLLPAGVAALAIPRATASVFPEPGPRPLAAAERPENSELDPAKPTVAIVLGEEGGNVADSLAPYEVFARAGTFNVLLVAPTDQPVPLTGGLDVVPDRTFDALDRELGRPADVIVVPQIHGSTDRVVSWLSEQDEAGAPLIMSVCVGAGTLADAGLLDGRTATSNWLGLIGLRRSYPDVNWVAGQRFVDTGDVITTGAVLSGIDGALRVTERLAGADVAARVADEIHWNGYRPGGPTAIPAASPRPPDLVALIDAAFRWDRPTDAVLLTNDIGEIELAGAFRPYTELSYAAQLRSVSVDAAPIRSAHGLTFVPRSDWQSASAHTDRILVPGVKAAASRAAAGLREASRTAYLNEDANEFAFDGAVRDLARTRDRASAAWVVKSLEYAGPQRFEGGSRWPWLASFVGLALAFVGGLVGWFATRRQPAAHFLRG
ncbi:DJ-1/PfpI family protein [Knoellia subterranea]|nr:DJ-1/PfpI family protein [Knoellia subterranea]